MSYDVDEMNSIGAEINKQIKEHVIYNILIDGIIEDVQRLNTNLNTDNIINGPIILVCC